MQVVTHCRADRRGGGSRGEWERTDDVTKSSRRRQKGRGGWSEQQKRGKWLKSVQFTHPPTNSHFALSPVRTCPVSFFCWSTVSGWPERGWTQKREAVSHTVKGGWAGEGMSGCRVREKGILKDPHLSHAPLDKYPPPSNTHPILQHPLSLLPSPLHSY